MKIEHVAVWIKDLVTMRDFYMKYFSATSNELYSSTRRPFWSYFLTFESGARLELMMEPGRDHSTTCGLTGLAHIAFSVGSRASVDALTDRLRKDGIRVTSDPRTTGDGYYESTILDPEGNTLEITADADFAAVT